STATSVTVRPSRPTRAVTCRPARSVTFARDAAIRASTSVNVLVSQSTSGQHQRRLCHTSTARRPNAGRSTNATWRRSFTRALVPHDRHATVVAVVSTWTRNGPAGSSSSTARTFTAGKPTNSAHMRVASGSTRAPEVRLGSEPPILRALEPSTADPRYPPTPPATPKRHQTRVATAGCETAPVGLWVIDLDGVVWRGPEAVPGSPDAVASLLERGDRVVFCTNDAAGPADKAEHLRRLGVPACPVITSADAVVAACADAAAVL